jgi:glycolate oxidase
VDTQAGKVERFCLEYHPLHIQVASNEEESDRLWMARRLGILGVMRKYKHIFSEDATLPISQIPTMIRRVRALAEKYGITVVMMGHAGDGNLHPCYCFDPAKEEEAKGFQKAAAETFRIAVELGGTLSGEHGIGLGRKEFLPLEVSSAGMRVMGNIKKSLDPEGILNPGKFV